MTADKLIRSLSSVPEKKFIDTGQKTALRLFRNMAVRVPAYKDFLKKNHINYKLIKSYADFQKIPPISKDNYLRTYPRQATCWDGDFKNNNWVISTTSGSTGEPFYFPRQRLQDLQYALTAEMYLKTNFDLD